MTRDVPTRIRRLRDEDAGTPDMIDPLAVLAILVALVGTTCLPLWTVIAFLAAGQPHADSGLSPATAPATQAEVQDGSGQARSIPTVTLIAVLVFFGIAVMGIIGGIGTILRRQWGRRLLLAYGALVLLYLITAVYLRMRFGIEGLTETAPTASALSLNLTCSFGAMLLVAVLMVVILRYFTQPHIARRFA
jgi:hypothetical protein